jgi:uridine phosphorylase
MRTDDDHDSEFILTPGIFLKEFLAPLGVQPDRLSLPQKAALAFHPEGLEQLVNLSNAKPIGDWAFPIIESSLCKGIYHGQEVLVSKIPPSAPNAVAFVECLICLGMTQVIVAGCAGSIHPEAKAGSIVIPTWAVRGEGTSSYYSKKATNLHASNRLVQQMQKVAERNSLSYLSGPTWTADGLFRESKREMERYKAQGILTVEMEMSALFALANFRKIELAGLLVISDTYFDGHKIMIFNDVYLKGHHDMAKVILEVLCEN